MTCRDFVAFLLAYLSDEVSAVERERFEAHLAECESCVAYVHTYQEAVRLGRAALADSDDAVPPEVPEELVQAVVAARRTRDR